MPFRAPIGTRQERNTRIIWPGKWRDATGFAVKYMLGYHTGADLNLNFPYFDADAHSGVYAMGAGIVTYAGLYSKKVWGNIIVINHGIFNGKPLFSRYGHVEKIIVQVNQKVKMGGQIASVGNGESLFPYHLHFDISQTEKLLNIPSHWPGNDLRAVRQHYVDPKEWLQLHIKDETDVISDPSIQNWFVIALLGLRIRSDHSIEARQVGTLNYGSSLSIEINSIVNQDSYRWGRIVGGNYNGDWIAMGKSDQSETYLSIYQPQL
jgi:murein DD-endopeptidase MepM/ murein hydrolase activator NlpD